MTLYRRIRTLCLAICLIGMAVLVTATVTGCSPGYVLRAAYEEGKILANREEIADVIASGMHPAKTRHKLRYVLAARNYAQSMGMDPKDSFTKFTQVDRDVLVWVLMATPPDSFDMYTWWYPIVGTVPYKGFFEKEDALAAAKELENQGYETKVRGSEAFSTLGWFNDPILSTTLSHHEVRVVNTVLHETFHQTVWIPDHVDFNESAANFVGLRGAVEFFRPGSANINACASGEFDNLLRALCSSLPSGHSRLAKRYETFEKRLAAVIQQLYDQLSELYEQDVPLERKLEVRGSIFHSLVEPLRAEYPQMKLLKEVNNAEIQQLRIYLKQLDLFEDLFQLSGESWEAFIAVMRDTQAAVEEDGSVEPFDWVRKRIESHREMPQS